MKVSRFHFIFITIIVLAFVLAGCDPARRLADGEHLLVQNSIRFSQSPGTMNGKLPDKDEMNEYIRQKPNRKIFGLFRFHLWIYNTFYRGKVSDEVRKIVGEPPVIVNDRLTKASSSQLKRFLQSKGYFHAQITDTVIFKKRKRAGNVFTIHPGTPYVIDRMTYSVQDSEIFSILMSDTGYSIPRKGQQYDEDALNEERERITTLMKNNGYYFFNKEYIRYLADSSDRTHRIALELQIGDPEEQVKNDSMAQIAHGGKHHTYAIGKVFILYDFNPLKFDLFFPDTMIFDGCYFIGNGDLKYTPQTLTGKVFFRTGELFHLRKAEDTYKFLSGLGVFKFINLQFREVREAARHQLDCFIQLSSIPQQAIGFETEGTYAGGNYGIAGNFVYRNNNIFHGAELLEFKIKAGLETQTAATDTVKESNIVKPLPFLNTVEVGPELNFKISKFLFFGNRNKITKSFNPGTTFTVAYNYLYRPDYIRSIIRGSMGYEWTRFNAKNHSSVRHLFQPMNINIVKLDTSSNILKTLSSITDPYIRASYIDHLISATGYTVIFTNQDIKKQKSFSFFKTSIEFAGNTLRLIRSQLDPPADNSGIFYLFNIQFAQYGRWEGDYRFYQPLNEHNKLVYRAYGGIGIPYGNSRNKSTGYAALPFEKSFFGGGANDNRAWFARTLGPGGLFSKNRFDRTGEFKLLGNMEYRADVYKIIKAAWFADAGNVWLFQKDISQKYGNFDFKRFPGEIAVGSGIGLRIDPGFFIIRIDVAVPLKEPEAPPGERWIFQPKTAYNYLRNTNGMRDYHPSSTFNFAIGYPF